jgi:LPS-assembly lipoprotein
VVEPLSIGSNARVQEYLVRYQVTLTVLGGDGKVLLDKSELELSREFSFDATQALGAASEQELITNELRREMLQQVLRRIATVH